MIMAVLPASDMIDFKLLKKAMACSTISLATEDDFKDLFPESEVGAMPPFGNLFGMDVVVADDLVEDLEIAFNAGSHRELVKMSFEDFERLVRPKVARVSVKKYSRQEENTGYSG